MDVKDFVDFIEIVSDEFPIGGLPWGGLCSGGICNRSMEEGWYLAEKLDGAA